MAFSIYLESCNAITEITKSNEVLYGVVPKTVVIRHPLARGAKRGDPRATAVYP
jgi:hypothetical protein